MNPQAFPDIFEWPTNLAQAKSLILTPEAKQTTEQRWENETQWLLFKLVLRQGLTIDFGCGIGRLSKHLPNVIGVDSSSKMRQLALDYVQRDDFAAISPETLQVLVTSGLKASNILCVWVLQHVVDLPSTIALLKQCLAKDGKLFVVNRHNRCVPTLNQNEFYWIDDQQNVDTLLQRHFELIHDIELPATLFEVDSYLKVYTSHG